MVIRVKWERITAMKGSSKGMCFTF